jgi:hypothetical protein
MGKNHMAASQVAAFSSVARHRFGISPIHRSLTGIVGALFMLCYSGLVIAAQPGQRLTRIFSAGESHQYRIQLVVRTDVEGIHAEKVGTKAYLRPFEESAEETVKFRAVSRVAQILADDFAQVDEMDDDFSTFETQTLGGRPHAAKLQDSLTSTLARWMPNHALTCSYRQSHAGDLSDVGPNCAPGLQEDAPALLTPWLRVALRPAVTLPERPIQIGASWNEPRRVQLPAWNAIQASEENTWLAADADAAAEPGVRLLTVQQIAGDTASPGNGTPSTAASGAARGGAANSSGKSNPADSHAAFHAESLTTISLQSGAVLAASRSASRELAWTPSAWKGPSRPPQFRVRLAAQITIEECHGSCATP